MVSSPLAGQPGAAIPRAAHLLVPTGTFESFAADSLTTSPVLPPLDSIPADPGAMPEPAIAPRASLASDALLEVLANLAGATRFALDVDSCAILCYDPDSGTLVPRVAAGDGGPASLAPAAMNPLPESGPIVIDLTDAESTRAGCVCAIDGFGAMLVSWHHHRTLDAAELGTVELAARLAAAAADQDRAGVLDLAAWRYIETSLDPAGEAVVARDGTGRMFHANAAAREVLGLDPVAVQGPAGDWNLVRALDLRDQWGQRVDPKMLPSARLRTGKPAPDLVVSARPPHGGSRRWMLLHAGAVLDGLGDVAVVITVLRNFSVIQRHDESHWLRSRIAEHLHQRPVDLRSIEHDIAAFLDGTCTIAIRGEPTRAGTPVPGAISHAPAIDEGATELHLACGHLHLGRTTIATDRLVADIHIAPHAVDIPIEGDGIRHGQMTCHRDASRPCFDREELELLTELAEQIGLALAVSRLRESLTAGERLLVDIGQRLQDAEEAERRRVALSIHDGLAQVAASVCQQLEIIAHRFAPTSDAESAELERARELAQRTVREARMLIAGLRPITLDERGLGAAVLEEIEAMRGDGWQIRFLDGLSGVRLAAEVELDVFRVMQEALTNVRKYAGRVPVEVLLEQRGHALHFEVRDHGAGFEPAEVARVATSGAHVGLGGMRERIGRLGGTIHIEAGPDRGTCVMGDVPV